VQTVAPALDVRIVNDKFTGQPRGFAFVHFTTIADATRVLHAFNVRVQQGVHGHTPQQAILQLANSPTVCDGPGWHRDSIEFAVLRQDGCWCYSCPFCFS